MTASPAASAAASSNQSRYERAVQQSVEQDRFDQLGMEVDRADETEGRLPEPGDADTGNPEQYYLPPQLGWVERRIEDVRGRDGPRL